jgi:hypothetical protein
MAGVAGRSGGANRVSVDDHLLRGTFRPDRHGDPRDAVPPHRPVASAGLRRKALRGLDGVARQVVSGLLGQFGDWDDAGIQTLRAYGVSCQRLERLSIAGGDVRAVHRETRINLSLLKSLELEPRK